LRQESSHWILATDTNSRFLKQGKPLLVVNDGTDSLMPPEQLQGHLAKLATAEFCVQSLDRYLRSSAECLIKPEQEPAGTVELVVSLIGKGTESLGLGMQFLDSAGDPLAFPFQDTASFLRERRFCHARKRTAQSGQFGRERWPQKAINSG
jgi:hypothetical protein